MRIAVIYDAAADREAAADVTGVVESVRAVTEALLSAGHAAFPVPFGLPLDRSLSRLARVDLVFNLAESVGGRPEGEAAVAALLELAGVPFTGSGSETLALCRRKDWTNSILAAAGLPVPPWALERPGDAPEWARYPAIVKPAGEDGSVGIHEWSVVEDAFELRAAIDRSAGPVLIQEFVGGRELNVGIVGREVLPVSEIEFSAPQRVVSYAAKWSEGSVADRSTRPVCPADLPPEVVAEVEALARSAWSALGGRGYGRVDLRMDETGRPWLLEVNPNPDLAPGAGLARMAAARGWRYGDLVDQIVGAALP
jgi:D-alanine-D-alanine ligase